MLPAPLTISIDVARRFHRRAVLLDSPLADIGSVLKRFEYAILGVMALAVIAFIWFRLIRPRRRGTGQA